MARILGGRLLIQPESDIKFLILLNVFVDLLVAGGHIAGFNQELNSFISYYEPVTSQVMSQAQVDVDGKKILYYNFQAFGRKFELELAIGSSILSPFAHIEIHDYNVTKYESTAEVREVLVEGQLVGDPTSFAHGDIYEGCFEGIITVPDEQYFIESSTKYFKNGVNFKSVIFRRSDTKFPTHSPSSGTLLHNGGVCPDVMKSTGKRSQEWNSRTNGSSDFHRRIRRRTWGNNVCDITLVADHTFYQIPSKQSVLLAITDMVKMIQEASSIFSKSDFDEDSIADEISLQVNKVTIWKARKQEGYTFGDITATPAETLLNITYGYNFSMYCLAVIFVHRDWDDLGIAYEGKPDQDEVGGICTEFIDGGSYNIVLISTLDNHGPVPISIRYVVVAHFLGHSFGSPHDPLTMECSPQEGGHYIMAEIKGLTSIKQPNNVLFSPCSLNAIKNMIDSKGTCFSNKEDKSTCGNTVLDEGEECDCGQPDQCNEIDPCCNPAGEPEECKFLKFYEGEIPCSPRHEICCYSNCTLNTHRRQKRCDYHKQCLELPDGGKQKPDGSHCLTSQYICIKGQCKYFTATTASTQETTQTTTQLTTTTEEPTGFTMPEWLIALIVVLVLLAILVVFVVVFAARRRVAAVDADL